MVDEKKKAQCYGCCACEEICPVGAIMMSSDEEGFLYPKVDKDVCVHCGQCVKVCPFESDYSGENAEPEIYAAIHKDQKVLQKSSSGAAFTAVSDVILENGGRVYGVKFDENFHVVYAGEKSTKGRNKFRGSKYVQSDARGILGQVELDLLQGKMVLFTGTPCQVEALHKYVNLKKINAEKLYTVDNICHGVASPELWDEYVSMLKKELREGEHLKYISMRSKHVPWRKQEMDVRTDQRSISGWINSKFSWNRFALSLFPVRPACFSCHFAGYKRAGDLTLADFWNFENSGIAMDDSNGVSLVLVNSTKGEELFEKAKEMMNVSKSDKKASWQIHLEFANNMPSGRKKFWDFYNQKGAEVALRKYTKGSFMNKLIRFSSPILRRLGLYTLIAQLHHKIGRKG